MSTSIRELILANVKTTLEGITTLAGYNNTFNNAQRWKQRGNPTEKIPCAIISAGIEEKDPEPYPQSTSRFSVFVEVYTRQDDTAIEDTDTLLNSLLLDVEKALAQDETRGGHAENTTIRRIQPFETIGGQPQCGFVIELEIVYQHKQTDPALKT